MSGSNPHRSTPQPWQHSGLSRRQSLQVGAIGILGMGMNHLAGMRQAKSADGSIPKGKAKSCIFIFLSGGWPNTKALT